MSKYVGITIGPIIETMSYTATPAGLWFASYFFSSITKSLCRELDKKEYDVLTVSEKELENIREEKKDNSGIGRYHDRVYARTPINQNEDIALDIQDIIQDVIQEKAQLISKAMGKQDEEEDIQNSLQSYLQIHYVIMEIEDKQKLANRLADALDALENCQSIVNNYEENYLIRMLMGEKNDPNCYIQEYITNVLPAQKVEMLQADDKTFKDLLTIATGAERVQRKHQKYYAIVQADGDGMGKVINSFSNDSLQNQENQIRNFSEMCMEYTSEAGNLVKKYDGVVIYAGGDDLLFLAPVVNSLEKTENIWGLCDEIGKKFHEKFAGYSCSVSFGISVNYYKFPLYEAFEDARNLLFGKAKMIGNKNNFAICVHKASGQSSGYVCCLESAKSEREEVLFSQITEYISYILEQKNEAVDVNQIMHSVLFQIENSKALCKLAVEKDKVKNYFENYYDNVGQTFGRKNIERISELLNEIIKSYKEDKKIALIFEQDNQDSVDILIQILRTAKFLIEEGKEEE